MIYGVLNPPEFFMRGLTPPAGEEYKKIRAEDFLIFVPGDEPNG
jgi:hypothetical protein